MHYSGDGITILVTKEDGTTESRIVPWSDLTTTTDGKGRVTWSYKVPESDGNYSYKISYETTADTAGLIEDTTVKNNVTDGTFSASGSAAVGPGEENKFTVTKSVVKTTADTTEWSIKVHVPAQGYDKLTVTDTMPNVWIDQQYYDAMVEGSLSVEGLLPGETYDTSYAADSNGIPVLKLTFYKDAASTTGLQQSGAARDLTIKLTTTNNQGWIAGAENSGESWQKDHTNKVLVNANGIEKRAEATSYPAPEKITKKLDGSSTVTIGGVQYPVYTYTLLLENVTGEPVDIQDTFDTGYLKYYSASDKAISVKGGNQYYQGETAGGSVTAEDSSSGINIHVSAFPKNGEAYYPVYAITYSLIVKDADALRALDQASLESEEGAVLKNTATWNGQESNQVTANHK